MNGLKINVHVIFLLYVSTEK